MEMNEKGCHNCKNKELIITIEPCYSCMKKLDLSEDPINWEERS